MTLSIVIPATSRVGLRDVDALTAYLSASGTLSPPPLDRIATVP